MKINIMKAKQILVVILLSTLALTASTASASLTFLSNAINTNSTLSISGGDVIIGTPTPSLDGATLTINGNSPLEMHSNFANGITLYTHADPDFRAPYINFYKSRGTQALPTPVRYTGYELDSIGGLNFGGWDGAGYSLGAAIYSQTDENWTPTGHGAHLSIYDTFNGRSLQNQVVQFGGLDPNGHGPATFGNVLFFRNLTFGGNQSGNPGIFYSSNPAVIKIRNADDSADIALTAGKLTSTGNSIVISTSSTPASATATCTTGTISWDTNFTYVCVATNTWKRSALATW